MSKDYFLHESSYVDDNVEIGNGTKIWHFSHIQEGAIIGVLGSIFGILFSLIVLLLEAEYHYIRLPNDIYFMDNLPVHIAPEYFFTYPFITLIITLCFSYIPAKKAANISPSEALRYE